jgi:hypothetical protein
MPQFKTHSALVAALAIDLEETGIRSAEVPQAHRWTEQDAASHSGKKSKEAIATPTNRPRFPAAKQKGESGDEEEGSCLIATATIRHPNLTPTQIDAGARVCYESFARDVGYANRARFVAFDKLKGHQKTGWRKLAEELVEAMRRARTV